MHYMVGDKNAMMTGTCLVDDVVVATIASHDFVRKHITDAVRRYFKHIGHTAQRVDFTRFEFHPCAEPNRQELVWAVTVTI